MAKYRILSLDGGGLKGLISARLLERLALENDIIGWMNQTDLYVGTSTGGIIALGLAAGRPLAEITDLYRNKGPKIFDDSLWDDIKDLGKTIGADYSNKRLKKEVNAIFGNTTLSQFQKKVAITSFDLDNEDPDPNQRKWKPKIFHNFSGSGNDKQQLARDVALYTSAAPTYFPSVDGYIDGGVFANNPSMVAYAQAISKQVPASERANPDEVVMLSVGTGLTLKYIHGRTLDWGFAQWVKPLIQILMEGVTGISDYQSKQILGDRYHRLQVLFDKDDNIELDDAKKLKRMDEIAAAFDITGARDWIKAHWL